MKNLFKSLRLVAVAAMAFTACQNEPEVIVNNGAESTTITFDATFAETRSQFGEKVEGGYPSTWTGNEEAIITHTTYCYQDGAKYVRNTESGAEARFVVEYNLEGYEVAPAANATIVAVTPSSAWTVAPYYDYNISFSPIAWEHTYTIPTQQTPSANSVDEAAHILKATVDKYDASGLVNLTFEHQVAYGKLSFKEFAGTGVTSVVLDIDGTKYTIETSATENIWFACEPATVQNMTVSVNATEGAFTKQIVTDGDNKLEFTKGRVSTFTVDFYGITTGEVIDTFAPDIRLETVVYTSDSNGNMFKFTSSEFPYPSNDYVQLYLNAEDHTATSIVTGTYTGNGDGANSNYKAAAGQFACKMSDNWTTYYPKVFTSASTLEVSFADNVYTIVLTHNGKTYGYKGLPDGWSAPGKVKTALATPEVSAQVVDDKNVNVTWNEVAYAANYTVSVNGVVKEAANTTRSYTIEGTYSTEYTITVVANPAADSEDYKASAAGSATVTTNADPNAGGGDEPIGPVTYDPWACSVSTSGSAGSGFTVTLTGTGENKDVIVLATVKAGAAGSWGDVTATRGDEVGSGQAYVSYADYGVHFNVTIGNVTYIGTTDPIF